MTPTARYMPSNSSLYGSSRSGLGEAANNGGAYKSFSTSTKTAQPSSSPSVEYTRAMERMRVQRESASAAEVRGNMRASNSSLDRLGISSSPSASPLPPYSGNSSSFLRSRSNFSTSSASTAYTTPTHRTSILESTDILKPVTSPYRRTGYSRTPSVSESVYDYNTRARSSYGSLPRRALSRDSSFDRSKDVRNNSRNGRKAHQTDNEEEEISISDSVKLRGTSNGISPSASPYSSSRNTYDQSSNVYSSRTSLETYDNVPSEDKKGILVNSVSSGPLQRSESVSSLRRPFSNRRPSRDLSVNFDLGRGDHKRDPSPIVAVMSRVVVEKDIPITRQPTSDVEFRYVISKFPVNQPVEENSRRSPAINGSSERERSRDRNVPSVFVGRGNEIPKLNLKSDYTHQDRGRVIGGKAFPSDSSLGSSSCSDDELKSHRTVGSIIRAGSPLRRPVAPSKKIVSVDESEKAGLIGLKNLGNTCFMNSILQGLSNTQPLRDYCLLGEWESEVNTMTSQMKGALISAFAGLLEALWKRHTSYSSTNPYVPDKFHRQVQQYAPRFSGYLQQDAQEFLRYLLEGLHEDVNRVTEKIQVDTSDIPEHLTDVQKASESWKRYLRRDNSKIVDLFVGQLKSSLICQSCGYCSVTYDPFWDLSLPIPGNRSGRSYSSTSSTNIYECFKLFTKEEMLDGEESPTCCHCKTKQKCRKFFTIQRFPKYLVIHLKRFSQERFRAKLSTFVDYPVDDLDLSTFAAASHTGPVPRYSLYAISCHSGSTHCGHYTAFCKHPISRKWNEYNDARVSPAKAEDVVTSEAYVLFYELLT